MNIINSSRVKKVGLSGGGAYMQADPTFSFWTEGPSATAGTDAIAAAQSQAEAGNIDPLEGLAETRAYIMSGREDKMVPTEVSEATKDIY